MYLKDTTMTLS